MKKNRIFHWFVPLTCCCFVFETEKRDLFKVVREFGFFCMLF
jgi:hypothetical protein